jgi:hypothetical protein
MSTKKPKLGKLKPPSQLFMFSNELAENISTYFKGNIIHEFEIAKYDFKYHEEAQQVTAMMQFYCDARGIKPFKYLTTIPNYKQHGVTLATISGEYTLAVAVHGKAGYEDLNRIHTAYQILTERLDAFEYYSHLTFQYITNAKRSPLKISESSREREKNQILATKKRILSQLSSTFKKFEKLFVLHF